MRKKKETTLMNISSSTKDLNFEKYDNDHNGNEFI